MGHDAKTPKPGVSRRNVLKGGAAAGIAAALGSVGAGAVAAGAAGRSSPAVQLSAPNAGGDGDLLLVNGSIHTMDGSNRVVNKVAIRNGRFAGVGSGAAGEAAKCCGRYSFHSGVSLLHTACAYGQRG
jgi:hypothetical protein